jgi:hypothetical protein
MPAVCVFSAFFGKTRTAYLDLDQIVPLKGNDFKLNHHFALACCLSVIFSDLASPAEVLTGGQGRRQGFAHAGNRYPPTDQVRG